MADPITVAVINHEPTFLRLMGKLLESAGYRPLTVPDSSIAYDIIKRDQPQAIIVDTWLDSRHAGWDLLQLLRLDEATASIPVIVTSSDDPKIVTERLAERSRDGTNVLFKPFEPEQLLKAVKDVLDRHHA